MDYQPREIEPKWRAYWKEHHTYRVSNDSGKPKYYVLDMFPYPSGAGLHVGHPLGYIASDIFSRYKRLRGFNVLHPMGYDAFGLPAEQYAIQTGVHPAISTAKNIQYFRSQLDKLGFCYDWDRQVNTSDPQFYKWTQWIFLQLFEHWYDRSTDGPRPIEDLKAHFARQGTEGLNAAQSEELQFSAAEWAAMSTKEQDEVLMNYRLAYRKVTYVNWCEELGTVLANDEVKDGVSERGGFPVERRPMLQWSLRITAYAQRLLDDLETVDFSESMKKMQGNWIGRSVGAQLFFELEGHEAQIEIFTTRPDTIFGATFMVLAPEHDLVAPLTTEDQAEEIADYQEYVSRRSERERMADVKEVTGAFTGSYAINPFNGAKIPVYIAEYVLKDYGTGAIMAVPADDERDRRFAEKYGLEIIEVIDKSMHEGAGIQDKLGKMINSDFLNGMEVLDAIDAILERIEEKGIGKKQINFRLRDAIYSRQRYWGEPFPIIYNPEGVTEALPMEDLPLTLPELDDFKPASGTNAPLARKRDWVELESGYTRETDTMPGFAGSSWYFLRYMDPHNTEAFVDRKAVDYWQDVDFYTGGTEHAVGHLMYSRFWHKFLYDLKLVPTPEPYKRLFNQGMIQGTMLHLHMGYFIKEADYRENTAFADRTMDRAFAVWVPAELPTGTLDFEHPTHGPGKVVVEPHHPITRLVPLPFGTEITTDQQQEFRLYRERVEEVLELDDPNASYFKGIWDLAPIAAWQADTDGKDYLSLSFEIGKMSKSKYNVINPDDIVARYGADCFRMYEMFLGPVEQDKPWNTSGIDGVSRFLRKFWGLFYDESGNFAVEDTEPDKAAMKITHQTIQKVTTDIERYSHNTCVSAFMVAANELSKMKARQRAVLEPLVVLIAPFAVHLAEELWHTLGHEGSVHHATWPEVEEKWLVEDSVTYPIAINGKTRITVDFPAEAGKEELERAALELDDIQKYLEGKQVRKVIVVPKRMINLVVS